MGLREFNVYDLIARNARIYADRDAWVFAGLRVTFRQYFTEVNRLVRGLQQLGLGKGDRLGVLALNCYEFILLYGAAAKLGIIMLPINWRLTASEIEYILADGQPRFFFVGQEFQNIAQEVAGRRKGIEKIIIFGAKEAGHHPFSRLLEAEGPISETGVLPDDPYLILPTAAISGKPRGATLSQGNLIAANLQGIAVAGLTQNDAYLHLLPLFHIFDIVLSLAVFHAGGKNVLLPKFDPEEALRLMEKERITTIGEFPPMLDLLLKKMDEKNYDVSSLKNIFGIDHPLNIEKMKKRSKAEFWIGFGQAETTGMVTLCPYSARPGSAGKEGPLVEVKLVDENENEVAVGMPGEICVRGPLVFLGYWNREEDNRYTFRHGWHHTGDIGRLDEKGFLWYVQRKAEKELIKPGGENVYPAEVEKVILEHPQVVEVSVIGVRDREWGEAIKAICVLRPQSTLTKQELIDFVAARIARYKKPKYVEFASGLPKATDGSIDRQKVKAEFGKE